MMNSRHRTWDSAVLEWASAGERAKSARAALLVVLAVGLAVGLLPGVAHAHDYGPRGLNGAQVSLDKDGYQGSYFDALVPGIPANVFPVHVKVSGKGFMGPDVAQIFQCVVGAVDLHAECEPLGAVTTDVSGAFGPADVVIDGTLVNKEAERVYCAGESESDIQCSVVVATFGTDQKPTSKAEHFVCFWAHYKCAPRPAASTHPVADFDGNGSTDVSVFRPSTSAWFVKDGLTTTWGTEGDIPVPGDYDGNGSTDVAVFRPSSGMWFVQGGATAAYGTDGDIPVPGDYNGDGRAEFAVFRPSSGTWFVNGGITANWGTSGDIPVPGDYNGDGATDIAVFRLSTSTWFVKDAITATFGTSGDIPAPGDYDGNGSTDIAVFRPSNGVWFVNNGAAQPWGTSGDVPVPGDYDDNGTTDFAVFRPSSGTWFVSGGISAAYGTSGDIALPLPYAIHRAFFPGPA